MRPDLQAKLKENILSVQRTFETEDGKKVLAILEESYGQQIFDPDPYRTAYKLGSHDLIQYIKRMVEFKL
jgi:hypothetical protein